MRQCCCLAEPDKNRVASFSSTGNCIPTTMTITFVFQNKADLFQVRDIFTVSHPNQTNFTDLDIQPLYRRSLCNIWQKLCLMYFSTELPGDIAVIIRNAVSDIFTLVPYLFICISPVHKSSNLLMSSRTSAAEPQQQNPSSRTPAAEHQL